MHQLASKKQGEAKREGRGCQSMCWLASFKKIEAREAEREGRGHQSMSQSASS